MAEEERPEEERPAYASLQDVISLFRPLTPAEQTRVTALLPLISDCLRMEAWKVHKDLDCMLERESGGPFASTLKLVTVDIVGRVLRQETEGEPMTQESQSGLGYVWSGTYAIPGGGIAAAIMRNDLKRLGLCRQQIGVIDLA